MIRYSKSENEVINTTLKELIRRHQAMIKLSQQMVDLYMEHIFAHFVSAALVLCSVSVNLLLVSDIVFSK